MRRQCRGRLRGQQWGLGGSTSRISARAGLARNWRGPGYAGGCRFRPAPARRSRSSLCAIGSTREVHAGGEPGRLQTERSIPARALFPGWYAMDSVKWLRRIVVLKRDDLASTFEESGMKRLYNRIVETA